jgi:hypothetical protein
MSAHEPQDQHLDAPVPPAPVPPAPRTAVPSVRALLASCAAARTLCTPPADDDLTPDRPPSRPADAA